MKTIIISVLSALVLSSCQHTAFVHEITSSQHPWSHEQFYDDPNRFQFVIVSDRTGCHRPGVFPDAVRKLNLLRPEFVISVGDLIEGYTRDREEILKQWNEFNSFISYFDMPFFYLPGNHDISNKEMADLWNELFGKSYYYFIYKHVLFLCLNTQETPGYVYNSKNRYLSDTQINWAKDVINQHPDVSWTCVFMHQPLWVYDDGYIDPDGKTVQPKKTGFSKIEEALAGRNYTVFAGHFHRYKKVFRKHRKYFILATTGAGSRRKGIAYEKYDHGLWVTMTDKGPVIANLMIEGIYDENRITASDTE
jgi:hypothetical protein